MDIYLCEGGKKKKKKILREWKFFLNENDH